MALTTADEPSARADDRRDGDPQGRERGGADVRIAKTKASGRSGQSASSRKTPSSSCATTWRPMTTTVEPMTAREIAGRGQRRAAHALEHARLPPHDEGDREPGEGVRGDSVAEQPDEEERRRVDALDGLVAVDRADQDEQEHGEEEAEERRLAVPPEELLLSPQLVEEEPHPSSSSRVSSR